MIRINLLPRVPRRRLPGRRVIEIGLPLAVAVVLVVTAVWMNQRNASVAEEVAAANREIAELQPQVDRVLELDRRIRAMREKETVIVDLLKQQLPAASILNEFRLLIPKDVWVTSLSVPEPSSLNIEGMAMTYYAVAQLMDNLATGRLFREVDLTVVQLERIGPRDVVRFQVTARIDKPQASGGDRQ